MIPDFGDWSDEKLVRRLNDMDSAIRGYERAAKGSLVQRRRAQQFAVLAELTARGRHYERDSQGIWRSR